MSSPCVGHACLPSTAGSEATMPCATDGQALQLGLRRIRGKQAPPASWRAAAEKWHAQAMVSDEAMHSSTGTLPEGAKSTHVHFTHGRSGGVGHRQPDAMTREEFWKHLLACYSQIHSERIVRQLA